MLWFYCRFFFVFSITIVVIRFVVWEQWIGCYLHLFNWWWWFRWGWCYVMVMSFIRRTYSKSKIKINIESDLITFHLCFLFWKRSTRFALVFDLIDWFLFLHLNLEWKFMDKLEIKNKNWWQYHLLTNGEFTPSKHMDNQS